MRRNSILLLLTMLAISYMLYCRLYIPATEQPTTYDTQNVESFGNSGTKYEMPAIKDGDFIVHHEGYTLSYNFDTNCPNWVAWELTYQEAGSNDVKRKDSFKADPNVPSKNRVSPNDYKGSGYDKGHMCPAADMKWSADAMSASFYMTNMCPQSPTLNRQWWEHLEKACRRWAINENNIWICCGPIYYNEMKTYIGNKVNVQVPDAFFKVVLSLEEGNEKAIGFVFWNDDSKQVMEDVAMSVDDIEHLTGYDFFSSLDDKLEMKVESEFNLKTWQ